MNDFAARNYFNHSHYRVQTFDTGILTPIFCRDVLPGDTWSEKTDIEIRAYVPPASPLMHQVYLKTYYFFVPNRIMWNDQSGAVSDRRPGFENFRTRGPDGKDTTTAPGLITSSGSSTFTIEAESILDYLGYPLTLSSGDFYSTLPLRACAMIWNHYFRDQDLQVPFDVDVTSTQESDWPSWWSDAIMANYPWITENATPDYKDGNLRINWEKDYFTSARPFAQKGDPTMIPLGSSAPLEPSFAPVVSTSNSWATSLQAVPFYIRITSPWYNYNILYQFNPNSQIPTATVLSPISISSGQGSVVNNLGQLSLTNPTTFFFSRGGTSNQTVYWQIETPLGSAVYTGSFYQTSSGNSFSIPSDWFQSSPIQATTIADLSNVITQLINASAAQVNDQRWAVQDQIMKEINMRGGNRIDEFYANHYKVKVLDERIQQPEFLSMGRSPIIFSEVLNQTSTSDSSPLGSFGGHGITASRSREFTRTFHEDGWIIGFAVVIPRTQYHQGIHRQFTRQSPYDYQLPVFNHTGEQPVAIRELYAAADVPEAVFGYQGRFDEYRRTENTIHGLLHTNLYYWSWARDFANQPALNSEFVTCYPQGQESSPFVTNGVSPWIGLVINHAKAVRPLPKRASPGLMDHR